MKAPEKINIKDDSDYLRVLTRAIFQAGFNWKVIENKWLGFEEAFDNFNVDKVASYDAKKISNLKEDKRIVRNLSKIEATIYNAQIILDKEKEFGSFKKYLSNFKNFEYTVKDLRKNFKWLGDFSAFYFLYVINEPVPTYEDWCKSRGIEPQEIDS